MKLAVTCFAITLTLTGLASRAQAPQATTGAATPPPLPAASATPAPAPAPGTEPSDLATPTVRLPGSAPSGTSTTNLPAGNDLEWGSSTETSRPIEFVIRTNRSTAPTGVGPRIAKPERKGFGGFLSGFANLFNPFAPTAQGTEVRNEFRYDGQINPAPLPRGLRDERTHEPQTELISVGLDGQNAKTKRSRATSSSSSPSPTPTSP